MTVDKEAISFSRVYSYYSKCNLHLCYAFARIVGIFCRYVLSYCSRQPMQSSAEKTYMGTSVIQAI